MSNLVHVTKASKGKMEHIPSINTNNLTNEYCKAMNQCEGTVCSKCYSMASLRSYRKSCQKPFERNSELLSRSEVPKEYLPILNNETNSCHQETGQRFFRFHSYGELINEQHLLNYINICDVNPNITFALWTKRSNLIDKFVDKGGAIPENLILVYSNKHLDMIREEPPKHFDKVFNVVTLDFAEKSKIQDNCNGQCFKCKSCYVKDSGINVIIEIEKNDKRKRDAANKRAAKRLQHSD